MPIFSVKLNVMSPQVDKRTGETKLDCNGDPLCSVQVIQSPEQKREMLKIMQHCAQQYHKFPELFPKGKHQIGNDPVKYTVAKMIKDFDDHFTTWYGLSSHHLYESYINRHNWMVEQMMEGLHIAGIHEHTSLREVHDNFYIKLKLPRHEEITRSLMNNELFDIK